MDPVSEFVSRAPAAPLRPHVEGYTGYRMTGFAPGVHRGLPGRNLTFIVSLDRRVEMLAMPDPRQRPDAMQAFVGGLATNAALIGHDGNQHGVAVDLTPFGAQTLFGLPSSAIGAQVIDLADLLGARGRDLPERLIEAPGWADRFRIVDEVLIGALRDETATGERHGPPPEVTYAWQRLVRGDGALRVDDLAAEVGWSRRHFTEMFRRVIGLPPRQMARVLRFERSKLRLSAPDRASFATIAADCGFYDQAHMNREWRDLAGCSPGQWLAEEQLPPAHEVVPSGSHLQVRP
jgi:AraC-like DNA-binding protein